MKIETTKNPITGTDRYVDVKQHGEILLPELKHWQLLLDGNSVLWIKIDKQDSAQNVLSADVLTEFNAIVELTGQKKPKAAVLYSEKPGTFIAGADINEFVQLGSEQEALDLVNRAHHIFNRWEALSTVSIALVDGVALGGGLELALACDYIVLSDDNSTKVGLPEVNLGIHPGFGGTARLIERTGAIAGMNLMLAGRVISSYSAKKMKVADMVVAKRHLRNSVSFLMKKGKKKANKSITDKALSTSIGRNFAAKKMREEVAKRAQEAHYPAPYKLIQLWQDYGNNRKEMLKQEAISIASLLTTDASRNLVKVFFMQEGLKKLGKSDIGEHDKVKHVHVIGAGVMGGDIAAWCALRGLEVTISDTSIKALAKAKARAASLFAKKQKDKRVAQLTLDRFNIDPKGDGIAKADIIIEAIVEKLDVKQQVFQAVEAKAKPSAILASNTSSIPLEQIAASLFNPGRLIGVHFFNPVAKMQLVEIINSETSDQESVYRGLAFTKQIGKLPVPVKSSPGFLVNRILMPYLMEAVTMYQEGVPAKVIDQAALDFGMPMGPIELSDVVGLDICLHVGETLQQHFGGETPKVLAEKVAAGDLGKKTGKGFYAWEKGRVKAEKPSDDSTQATDVADRLMLRYLNESVACLREGVVAEKDWLDGSMVFGTGFAPFRAGPMNYIQDIGVDVIKAQLTEFSAKYGDRFTADAGWDDLS